MDKKGDNNAGLASTILGILSVILSPLVIFGALLGVIGLVFGIIQQRASKNKWSLWGIILSALGIIISLIILFMLISVVHGVQEFAQQCLENPSLPGCEAFAGIQQTAP